MPTFCSVCTHMLFVLQCVTVLIYERRVNKNRNNDPHLEFPKLGCVCNRKVRLRGARTLYKASGPALPNSMLITQNTWLQKRTNKQTITAQLEKYMRNTSVAPFEGNRSKHYNLSIFTQMATMLEKVCKNGTCNL